MALASRSLTMTWHRLSLLLTLAWTLQLAVGSGLTSDVMNEARSGCEYPFQFIGNRCFYFSEETRNFEGAKRACENLGHGYHVSLAMLDFDKNEDQLLLEAAAENGGSFWVGASTEDGIQWKWQDEREIYIQAPYWYHDEPNESTNKCASAQTTISGNLRRSYIYDSDCTVSLYYICEIGCPFEYTQLGKYCYYMSEMDGLSHLNWQESREYCQDMQVPVGYHADLAVLGLDDQDDYWLINNLAAGYSYTFTWLGGYAETSSQYKWVDGRDLSTNSIYWDYNDPAFGGDNRVFLLSNSLNRTYLRDQADTTSYPFICQIFKD